MTFLFVSVAISQHYNKPFQWKGVGSDENGACSLLQLYAKQLFRSEWMRILTMLADEHFSLQSMKAIENLRLEFVFLSLLGTGK